MKKFVILSLILLSFLISYQAPSILTSSGGLHTLTALTRAGRLTLSSHYSFASKDFPVTYAPDSVAWDTYIMGDINFGMAYTFTNWLEISIKNAYLIDAIRHDKNAPNYPDGNYISHGFGDTELGLKLSTGGFFGTTNLADIGVYGFYRINTGQTPSASTISASFASIDYTKNDGGIFRYFTSNSRDYGAIGIFSVKTNTQIPIELNINGGYVYRTIIATDTDANYYVYGTSFLFHFNSFVPFVEFFGNKLLGMQFFEDQYIVYGAGGVRFDTPIGIVVDLGADYRLTTFNNEPTPDSVLIDSIYSNDFFLTTGWGATPDWKIHLGLSYYYDFIKDAQPIIIKEDKKTLITGKIVDIKTGEPLTAEITLPGYTEEVSVVSDSLGNYRIEVIPGTIRIKVQRSGYKWKEKGIIIEKGQTKILDFALTKKQEEKGIITGKIIDKSNNEIVIAKIKFPNTEIPDVTVDATTGVYRIELKPGTYTMAAVADGYLNWTQPVVIENQKTLVMNIEMLKKGGKIELRGIYFDSGKASIKPESYPVLDNAVELLRKNPKVRIEIQGHTDSVGSSSSNLYLSQSRAESVRNYLIAHGIDSWRIIAKGYGESMPIAENTTRDGRARNRRIEFLILGE